MKQSIAKQRKERDRFKLNFRLERPVWEQLKRLAEREDRTMPYFARVFIKAGLDDRAKGVRANGNS